MKTYITNAGDMWDSIALSQMCNEFYSNQLIDANPQCLNTVIFESGVELNIPILAIDNSRINLPPWKR